MSRKTIAGALSLASVFILLPATLAAGEYRGSDMWSNLAPPGSGGLSNLHPLSYYALDYHIDGPSISTGGVSAGDPAAAITQWFAAQAFALMVLLMRLTIAAFDWAYNIDIIGGHNGVLQPVGIATQHLYTSTFVPLLTATVLVFGAWVIAKVAGRKFGEAGVGAARAICLSAAALVIIFNPAATIGQASALSRELAGSIASGTTGGNGGQSVGDRIFDTFIYRNWAVLQFSGIKICVSDQKDSDGFPKVVSPNSSQRTTCHNTLERYAPAFLKYAPGSSERNKLYNDIKDGKAPYDKTDAGAVDMMQAGGAVQRLTYTVILCLGMISAILLLGLICFASLFAQLGLLVLLGLAPAMVIAGFLPPLHGIFVGWAEWIGKFMVSIVIFSLLLSVTMGISVALLDVGGALFGYLGAYALQSLLFIGIFLKRKDIAKMLTSGNRYKHSESKVKSFVGGAAAGAMTTVASPVATAAAVTSKRLVDRQEVRQEAAAKAEREKESDSSTKKPAADSSSPPAGAGREFSPNPPAAQPVNGNTPSNNGHAPNEGVPPMPSKSFKQELEEERAARAANNGKPPAPKPLPDLHEVHKDTLSSSFPELLERERSKQQAAKRPD